MTRTGSKARFLAAGAVALALAACDDRGGRMDAPEPAPLADLSATEAMPYAEPARVDYRAPAQGYAWAERAYGLQRAVYDAPPDYGFDYGGAEPLAWETDDDWAMYAEPWDDGYRYYYYEPGADYPYFVRDDDYGYGYGAGGVLVAVFDSGGRYLPVDTARRMAPDAGRYYARGHDLRAAAHRAQRIQVTDQAWAQRAPQVIRTADPWLRAARDDREWRAWRDRDQARELRRFQPEAARRAVRAREWREAENRREAGAIRANDDGRRREVEARQQRIVQEPPRQAERRRAQAGQPGRQAERQMTAQRQNQQAQRQQARQQQVEQQHRQRAEQQQAQRQQARRQQAEQQQQQRQQAEQQRAQRQQADQQRHQAERQQPQRQQAQRDQQRQPQAQARSAQQQGQPAAGREHDNGPGQGRGKGRDHDRKG